MHLLPEGAKNAALLLLGNRLVGTEGELVDVVALVGPENGVIAGFGSDLLRDGFVVKDELEGLAVDARARADVILDVGRELTNDEAAEFMLDLRVETLFQALDPQHLGVGWTGAGCRGSQGGG